MSYLSGLGCCLWVVGMGFVAGRCIVLAPCDSGSIGGMWYVSLLFLSVISLFLKVSGRP